MSYQQPKTSSKTVIIIVVVLCCVLLSSSSSGLLFFFWNRKKTTTDTTTGTTTGTTAGTTSSEKVVYHAAPIGASYDMTQTEATATCRALGGELASKAQLTQAYDDGAEWCSCGWTSDNNTNGYFPMQSAKAGCSTKREIIECQPAAYNKQGKYNANCYGVYPAKNKDYAVWPK